MTWENDRLAAQSIISMEMTLQAAEGWELHSIQHAGHHTDKPEIHRYVIVYWQEVERKEAMLYVLDEILDENISDFEDMEPAEVVEYIRERYKEKVEENLSEIRSANESNNNTKLDKS